MGSILFSTGDALDQTHLRTVLARSGISNFVQDGLSITVDYQNAVMDVTAGLAFTLHNNNRDVTFVTDAVAGQSIPSDGVNEVHLATEQVGQEPPEYAETYIVGQGTPSGPSLHVATIDMGAQSVDAVNRETPVTDALSYKGNDIDSNADGVVNRAEWANNVNGEDVDGEVAQATNATTVKGNDIDGDGDGVVDRADAADSVAGSDVNGQVDSAASAENAATVGGESPSAFADANHTHNAADIPSAQNATRFDGWTRRAAAINMGTVEFPMVTLGTGEDSTVSQTRFVRAGTTMNVCRVHVCDGDGGGVPGVALRMENLATGFTHTHDGHWAQGTVTGFIGEDDEEVLFELVNNTTGAVEATANVRYFFTEN